MNYYISDIHLGCVNSSDGRTLEHDALIKHNWNSVVTNGDTVYILGDIGKEGSNRDNEYLCEIISTLKGNKILVQGNHEKVNDLRLKQLFKEIVPYKELTDNFNGLNHHLVLCHYPILMWKHQHKGWIHLYGHLHNTIEEGIFQNALADLNAQTKARGIRKDETGNMRAYNVGAMLSYMGWTPRTLKEIMDIND